MYHHSPGLFLALRGGLSVAMARLLWSGDDGRVCVSQCAGLLGHAGELWGVDRRGALCWVFGVDQLFGGRAHWSVVPTDTIVFLLEFADSGETGTIGYLASYA